MAIRRLDITLRLDRAEYRRGERAARAESKATAEALIADADAAERAKVELARRANARRLADATREGKAEVEAARGAAAAEMALDADVVRAHKRAAAEMESALRAMHRDEVGRMEAQAGATDRAAGSLAGAAKQALSLGSAMLGLQGGQAIFGVLADHAEKFRKYLFDSAEKVNDLRTAMRELSVLRGEAGATGPALAHVMGLTAETLQSPADVAAMEQSAIGIGELAIGRTVPREEFEKFLAAVGKMQTMEGGDAAAYGALAGQLVLLAKPDTTAADLQAQFARLIKIQQPGGFTSVTQAAEQFAKVLPLVQSGILSVEQAMATLSAFSVSSPGESATMTDQFVRAVLSNRVKGRNLKLDPELDFQLSYDYMKSLGADRVADPIEIGKLIAADFAKQEEAAKAAGKKWDPYTYLLQHGFGNEQDRQTIMLMAGLRNSKNLAKIEEAQASALDLGEAGRGAIDRQFEEAVATDPNLQRRQTGALAQLNELMAGLSVEALELWQRAAFNQLAAEGKQHGTYEDWKANANSYMRYGRDLVLGATGQYDAAIGQVDSRVMANMIFAMKDRGMALPGIWDLMGSTSNETWARYARALQQAGANPVAGDEEAARRLVAELRRLSEATEQANRAERGRIRARPGAAGPGGVPAPIPGRQTPIDTRPN